MVWEPCRVQRPAIEIVAHRGGPDFGGEPEPEHSLAAYLRAIDRGADALECDVRLILQEEDRACGGQGGVLLRDLLDLGRGFLDPLHGRLRSPAEGVPAKARRERPLVGSRSRHR